MAEMTLTEYLHAAHRCERGTALWTLTLDYLRPFGVRMVSYHDYGGQAALLEAGAEATLAAEGFPDAWVDHYIAAHLSEIDPIVEAATRSASPLFWEDVCAMPHLDAGQREFVHQLHDAGLGDGVALAVHGTNLRDGYVGLGFGGRRPSSFQTKHLAEIQAAMQCFHGLSCMLQMRDRERWDLSPRERTVLGLIMGGLSNAMISSRLSVSRHTTDTLVRRIFAKLNVNDRTAAVVTALRAGINIKPSVVCRRSDIISSSVPRTRDRRANALQLGLRP